MATRVSNTFSISVIV